MPPPPYRAEALSDDARLTRSVCLSVAYIGPKSRTERPRKAKIGTEVAHVIRDSGHHFQGQKIKGQGHRGQRHIVAASRAHSLLIVVGMCSVFWMF